MAQWAQQLVRGPVAAATRLHHRCQGCTEELPGPEEGWHDSLHWLGHDRHIRYLGCVSQCDAANHRERKSCMTCVTYLYIFCLFVLLIYALERLIHLKDKLNDELNVYIYLI